MMHPPFLDVYVWLVKRAVIVQPAPAGYRDMSRATTEGFIFMCSSRFSPLR